MKGHLWNDKENTQKLYVFVWFGIAFLKTKRKAWTRMHSFLNRLNQAVCTRDSAIGYLPHRRTLPLGTSPTSRMQAWKGMWTTGPEQPSHLFGKKASPSNMFQDRTTEGKGGTLGRRWKQHDSPFYVATSPLILNPLKTLVIEWASDSELGISMLTSGQTFWIKWCDLSKPWISIPSIRGNSVTMLELWKTTPCGKAWSQSLQVQKRHLPVLSFCRSLASKKDCYKHMLVTWAELTTVIWKMVHMGSKGGGKTWGARVLDEKKEEWGEPRKKWQNSQSGHQRLQKNKRWEHGQ